MTSRTVNLIPPPALSHKPLTPQNKPQRKHSNSFPLEQEERWKNHKKKWHLKIANLFICIRKLQWSVYFLFIAQSISQREKTETGEKKKKKKESQKRGHPDTTQLHDNAIQDGTNCLIHGISWNCFRLLFVGHFTGFQLGGELYPPLSFHLDLRAPQFNTLLTYTVLGLSPPPL